MLKQLKQHVLSHHWLCNDQLNLPVKAACYSKCWFRPKISQYFARSMMIFDFKPVYQWTYITSQKLLDNAEVHPARPVVPKKTKSQSLSGEKSQMPDSQETNCIQSTVNKTLWQHTVFTESTRTVQRCSMISCDRAFCCILRCMFTRAQCYEHVHQLVCDVLFLRNLFLLPV